MPTMILYPMGEGFDTHRPWIGYTNAYIAQTAPSGKVYSTCSAMQTPNCWQPVSIKHVLCNP